VEERKPTCCAYANKEADRLACREHRYSIDTVHNSLTHYLDFQQMVTRLPLDLSSVVRTRSKSSRQHSAQVFNNASANVVPVGEAT
jgi:hypothetical protein